METIAHLLRALIAALTDRNRLAVENVVLRQQIIVLKRSVNRAKLDDSDRMFWIFLRRWVRGWRDMLHIVKPEKVIAWHRNGFRYYWKRRCASKPGRPPIGRDVIALIKRMSNENPLRGAPHIQSELALLRHAIGESTVAKYMVRHPRDDGQRWLTFVRNHMNVSAACDFFVVPTLTFKALYVFVILSHERRRILHVGVTRHLTDEWTANQLTAAFPDGTEPKYLHRDRDNIYGEAFVKRVRAFGIEEVISARKSPWQNPFVERVIGSIRRECTDHVIALGERHLLRALTDYVAFYNRERTHLSLERHAPERRRVERKGSAIMSTPVLNGLHHTYSRAA